MPSSKDIADDLISGSLKKSESYHKDYGRMTYGEIRRLSRRKPHPDMKARQMKKLIEQPRRLQAKNAKKPKK